MLIATALAVVALALSWPSVRRFAHVGYLFTRNGPGQMPEIHKLGGSSSGDDVQIKFAHRIRSCEDALLVESAGLAILACDPGRERWNTVMGLFLPDPVENGALYIYDYTTLKDKDDEDGALQKMDLVDFPLADSDFHTLGMAYDESTSTLLVANHRRLDSQPSIEKFKVDLAARTATHVRSIQHPLIHGPNAIVAVSEDEFYVTNDHYFTLRQHPILNKVETYLGLPLGSVVHVVVPPAAAADQTVAANVVARVPFANGIELLNETTAVVSATSVAQVYFFSVSQPSPSSPNTTPVFTQTSRLTVNFLPDNISRSKDGSLMIAGHPCPPLLVKFSATRNVCNSLTAEERTEDEEKTCVTVHAPSAAARWTEQGGLEYLYSSYDFPTSATALWDPDRGVGIISGLYAKGILVWRNRQ